MPFEVFTTVCAVLAGFALIGGIFLRLVRYQDTRLAKITADQQAMPAWQRKRRLQRRRTYVKLPIAGFGLNRFGP